MEINEITVALKHKEGSYGIMDLAADTNALRFTIDKYGIAECDLPATNSHIRVYSLPDNLMDTLEARYDEHENLQEITYDNYGQTRYLYINLSSDYKDSVIKQYVAQNVQMIADRILESDEPVMRLIFDSFYDGEAVSYYATAGRESDRADILEKYGNDSDILDNSGNYPRNKWIFADNASLGIILMCSDSKERNKLFNEIKEALTEGIINLVDSRIAKTEDYKVITNQFD
ncbi:MAG: hypothetical protein MJ103_04675 [Saccharofermentans sp.]|nr:hypothetical protein [Saccharofermentans sp.]